MPNFSRGEVLLTQFPFTDLSGGRVRPCLVVSPGSDRTGSDRGRNLQRRSRWHHSHGLADRFNSPRVLTYRLTSSIRDPLTQVGDCRAIHHHASAGQHWSTVAVGSRSTSEDRLGSVRIVELKIILGRAIRTNFTRTHGCQ